MTDQRPEKSPLIFIIITLLLSIVFSLAVAEWVLGYQRKSIENSEQMDPGLIQYDTGLGWRLKAGWTGKHHHHDYDASYSINTDGFRETGKTGKGDGYAIVGDSFSFGLGVDDEQTFTALLNNKWPLPGQQRGQQPGQQRAQQPGFVNYSVPGYSTDQQLLLIDRLAKYSIAKTIEKNIILVIYLGNDIFDNMLAFPLQAEHGKPYFILDEDRLTLNNSPVPRSRKDAAARNTSISSLVLADDFRQGVIMQTLSSLEINRRLNLFQADISLSEKTLEEKFSPALKLTSRLVLEIEKNLSKHGSSLKVVLLPGRSYVVSPSGVSAQYQEYFRKSLKASLEAPGSIIVLDLASYLRELDDQQKAGLYYPYEGHLTPLGHELVASYLRARLYSANESYDEYR